MKIAIIGGGFAGLLAGYKLLSKGYKIDLYEEHKKVGYPPHCTGLISENTVYYIGRPAERSVEQIFEKLQLEVNNKKCILKTKNKIIKLNRIRIEKELLNEFKSNGGRIFLGFKIKGINVDGRIYYYNNMKKYDMIVLAEGYHGRLRETLGIHHDPITSLGVNIELPLPTTREYFKVKINNLIRGFLWTIPLGDRTLIGGLSIDPGQIIKIIRLINKKYKRLRIYGGRVIHGPPLPQIIRGRVAIIGDAASMNKPLTGGGLWPTSYLIHNWMNLIDEKGDPLTALGEAYVHLRRKLMKQYIISKIYFKSWENIRRKLVSILASLISEGLCDLLSGKIGYDDHEKIISLVLRNPGFMIRVFRDLF